ncbi:tail fiber domain-containing protein [Achromobacter sp.]|uniref:tail fiber domain-containing protein n=1 Tax=Achromobacter sp. TaxID=134375 RepID=UPI0028AEE4EE|nr:hypothetical protein [Achromobacter sp.]
MARLFTLRRNLARLLTWGEVDDNFVNVATDFSGSVDPAGLDGAHVLPFMRWADTGTGWLRRRNGANDAWINEQRLLRNSLAVFQADEVPTQDVGPICIVGKGYAEWDAAGGGYRMQSGQRVGTPDWWPLRASVPAGQFPLDGQTISRAIAPDLTAMVLAGTLPIVTEADWLADPSKRGCYTLGDGSTTIRLPDFNGKSAGSLGAVFRRGDGTLSTGIAGQIQRDALQNIAGTFDAGWGALLGRLAYDPNGANPQGPVRLNLGAGAGRVINSDPRPGYSDYVVNYTFDASLVARTATETRGLNVTGVWTVHAFGTVQNPGSADLAQLATDYGVLNAAFQSTKSKLDTLWDGTTFNLMPGGRFILGNFDGAHTATTTSFRQGQPSTSVTYLPVVPPVGGVAAYTIHRSAADANSKFLAMGVDGNSNFADITFSRHGSAAALSALRFISAATECGRVYNDGSWTLGLHVGAVAANAQSRVSFAGASVQWGLLMCPRANDGAAIAFQNSGGGLVGSIVTSATATAFNTSSDYRLKTVTGDANRADALARILRVSIREFIWKADGRPDRGVLAHELADSHPNAVSGEKDAMFTMPGFEDQIMPQSVDYSKLVPDLVLAVQAMQGQIDALTARLAESGGNQDA